MSARDPETDRYDVRYAMEQVERDLHRLEEGALEEALPFGRTPGEDYTALGDEARRRIAQWEAVGDAVVTLDDYDRLAWSKAIYPGRETKSAVIIPPDLWRVLYPALKLAGEAGEFAEKVGKIIRDKGGVISDADRVALLKELGDCLWYNNAAAHALGSSLKEVAELNVAKLTDRHARGVLGGEGDER